MRLPLTKDGAGVMAGATLILVVLGGLVSLLTPWLWVIVVIIWGWVISFFRDPARNVARRPNVLYAPADGKVTEVAELDHHDSVGGPCVRIRIFLNIFNVHINRMPCAASITSIHRQAGQYLNALKPESAEKNESNTLILDPETPFLGPIALRQIAGLIARTIVCHVHPGDSLASGERIGMIKFGSGTELVVPRQDGLRVLVHVGQSVYAGLTEVAKIDTIS